MKKSSFNKISNISFDNKSQTSEAQTSTEEEFEYTGFHQYNEVFPNVSPEADQIQHKFKDLIPLRKQVAPRRSLTDYYRKQLKEKPIFTEVKSHKTKAKKPSRKDDSILVDCFGLRNISSLQDAILNDEKRRLIELFSLKTHQEEAEEMGYEYASTSSSIETSVKYSEAKSQTDVSTVKSGISEEKKRVAYLMGLSEVGEEQVSGKIESEKLGSLESEEEVLGITGKTEAMRKAQKYLRLHRIFEFFQFIIAHMLSKAPENPIEFILELLDKCLLYRSGLGKPPLLYQKRHIEQLFNLMDRMRTGFIELDQYKVGMNTLAICTYNKNPPLGTNGLVAMETFINEAYDSQVDIFNELIRRRLKHKPKDERTYMTRLPTTIDMSAQSFSGLMPPYVDSRQFYRKMPSRDLSAFTDFLGYEVAEE